MKIVIAGGGSVGRYLIERLAAEDHDLVLIDLDEAILDDVASHHDLRTVTGSASSVEDLRLTGIEKADIFVAATDSDETNLIACLLADSMNERARKIARVRTVVTDDSGLSPRLRQVFDHFINPDEEAVTFLMRLFEVPGASEVIDFADGHVRVVGVSLLADSPVVGSRLADLASKAGLSGMLVVSIIRKGKVIIPSGDDTLEAGDSVYVVAEPHLLDSKLELFGLVRRPLKSAMIWGGGGVGRRLSTELLKRDVKVKLIHGDPERCEKLAAEFNDVLVLNGDATDRELLENEGIDDVDVFVGATADDEDNILSALLAKSLGAKRVAVLVNKTSYMSLVTSLGVDIVVSPRIAAASSILKFLRSGSVSSVFSTRDDTAEVLEILADEDSKVIGKPLKDIKFPPDVIVAAVVNEDLVTIPSGETTILPNDRVIIFSHRNSLRKLEKLLDLTFCLR